MNKNKRKFMKKTVPFTIEVPLESLEDFSKAGGRWASQIRQISSGRRPEVRPEEEV